MVCALSIFLGDSSLNTATQPTAIKPCTWFFKDRGPLLIPQPTVSHSTLQHNPSSAGLGRTRQGRVWGRGERGQFGAKLHPTKVFALSIEVTTRAGFQSNMYLNNIFSERVLYFFSYRRFVEATFKHRFLFITWVEFLGNVLMRGK